MERLNTNMHEACLQIGKDCRYDIKLLQSNVSDPKKSNVYSTFSSDSFVVISRRHVSLLCMR